MGLLKVNEAVDALNSIACSALRRCQAWAERIGAGASLRKAGSARRTLYKAGELSDYSGLHELARARQPVPLSWTIAGSTKARWRNYNSN
jgi:hypothetical protein